MWSNYPKEEPTKEVVVFGESFDSGIKSLDVSKYDVESSKVWVDALKEFPNLELVDFGDKTISLELKKELTSKYPNIKFKVVAVIDFYGEKYREDITSLDLNSVSYDDDLVTKLASFNKLEEVDLSKKKISKDLQLKLAKEYPNIYFKWTVKILDKEVTSDIEKLDFTGKTINNYDEFADTLALLSKLTKLEMANTNLTNEQLGALRELYPNVDINWIIHFGVWSTRTDVVSFSTLVGGFHYVRLTDEDIQVLKYCTKLQALDLGHQAITDLDFIADSFPELRVLIMADNKTLSDLKPLTKLKHLNYLEVFLDAVTDITPLVEIESLVDLNLSFNRSLTDIDALIEHPLPNIERLWVPGCPISDEDKERLVAAYPNAKVIVNSKGSTLDGWRTVEKYTKMIAMFRDRTYIDDIFTAYN